MSTDTQSSGDGQVRQPALASAEPSGRAQLRLALLAAAILYLELAIIRFTSAQVLYLGYFSNFILISTFVGLGLGFLATRRPLRLDRALPFLFLFLFALVLVATFDVDALRNRGGLFFFGNRTGDAGLPGLVLLPLLFLATAGVFAGLAQQAGRLFERFAPIRAYSLDVGGSLIGILLFSLQSYFWTGPVGWVITATLLLIVAALLEGDQAAPRRAAAHGAAGLAVVVLLLAQQSGSPLWSSYQKLELGISPSGRNRVIRANGIPHQLMLPVKQTRHSFYQRPFAIHAGAGGKLDRVLVLGAGSGTDVALALAEGARSVDAVEIDAGILELGRRHHPDRPYDDPRVTAVVADGREHLRRSGQAYDLILFALPDSLIRLSPSANLRLESYLFTLEAFADARARLAPGGSLILYNQIRWPWLELKIAMMLEQTFGHPPVVQRIGSTTVLAAGERLGGAPLPRADLRPATDDWPFVYMERPGLSWPYIGMIGMFLLAALLGVRLIGPPGALARPDWPFFLMGVAFLLLETRSISSFSLLFGSTWLVNALVFAGILSSVLLANAVVARASRPHAQTPDRAEPRRPARRRWLVLAALAAALALAYVLRPSALLAIGPAPLRYLVAVAVSFAPVFLANLVFSREFRDTDESSRAFGWNLLGAVAGGGVEYLTMLLGSADLLWIAAACYGLVGLLLRRPARSS